MTVTLPQKMLAVHSGLALYGRNNICYHEEFGSYMQIMSYVSDLPCEGAPWHPLRRMEQCERCSACIEACPTEAIDTQRRLVDSDRCITFFNEKSGVFPNWLDPSTHNSIVGCIRCQDCCPANAHHRSNVVEGVAFTEEETAEIIHHREGEPYSEAVAAKLKETELSVEYIDCFPRNLTILLQQNR